MLWSLFYWVLTKYLTLLAFIITLIAIRMLAAIARRNLPSETAVKLDTFRRGLIYVSCGMLIASVLWYFREQIGITWISKTAIYSSLTIDLFLFGGVVFYFYSLRRLRKDPDQFPFKVSITQSAQWPDSGIVTRPIRLWLSHLAIARKWSAPELQIAPQDFTRHLRGDIRFVDEILDRGLLGLTTAALEYVPHLAPETLKSEEDSANKSETNGKMPAFSSDAQRILNRALIAKLPDDLWSTSTRLCQTSPQIICASWKQFYQQKSLRLRLASLFNTADMLERLIGALALAVLREEGSPEIENLSPPQGNWSEILKAALEDETNQNLAPLRRVLLTPRKDFQSLLEKLKPLREVLGDGIFNINGSESTLAGWRLLEVLRNKLIGHGGVGWKLSVDVTRNLSSLHFFFLAMMQDISRFDLGLLAVYKGKDLTVVGLDQGFNRAFNASELCSVLAVLPESQSTVELNPYFKFNDGRLLVLNRYSNNQGKAEYIDYNSANPLEPSFFSFPEDKKTFWEKRPPPNLSFTDLGTSLRIDLRQNETVLQEVAQKTNLAASLISDDKCEEALLVIDDVIERCKSFSGKAVKFSPILAELLFAYAIKARCLLKRERTKEAFAVARQIWNQTQELWDSVEDLAAVWDLLIQKQRNQVINEVALSLIELGSSLVYSRKFAFALICNHLACMMFENIPEEHRKDVPIFSFASASFDKSYSLHELSDPAQAITSYKRTITLFEELLDKAAELEQSFGNRVSEFDDYAKSVSHKVYGSMDGIPAVGALSKRILPRLGKLLPVELLRNIAAQKSAIAITSAHEKYGKPEVVRNLRAKAWGNIGLAFQALDDFAKSLSYLDQAIELHRELLADIPSIEYAGELARTLENRALVLSEMQRWQEALNTYSEAITLYESCLEAGGSDFQPRLLRTIRQRLSILLRQRSWNEAGIDISRLLNVLTASNLQDAEVELVGKELKRLISNLHEMQHDDLECLYLSLGSDADKLRGLMEEPPTVPEDTTSDV